MNIRIKLWGKRNILIEMNFSRGEYKRKNVI